MYNISGLQMSEYWNKKLINIAIANNKVPVQLNSDRSTIKWEHVSARLRM